jgi:hypothetical protein
MPSTVTHVLAPYLLRAGYEASRLVFLSFCVLHVFRGLESPPPKPAGQAPSLP